MEVAALGLSVDSTGVVKGADELDRFTKAANDAGTAADRTGNEARKGGDGVRKLGNEAQRTNTSLTSMARTAVRLGAALGIGLSTAKIVRDLTSFEQSMANVAAITRATGTELAELREVAKELGATTEFTSAQAAEGLRFLGMAGFSAAESISAIPAILDLATAAAMDLGRAADITSNIMSAFGIAAGDSAKVADVLAAAASRANTDVEQLGDAMKYAGPVAQAFGISINDAAAAVGTLSDAGIQGGMAGTGLRRVMSSLANPTKQAADALAGLGIAINEVNPATTDLVDIVELLASRGLGAAEALTIFGDRGGPAILALVENNAKLRELTGILEDVDGEAKRMADTMRDNLGGDLKGLISAFEAVILAVGESGVTGALRSMLQVATTALRALADNIDRVMSVVQTAVTAFISYRLAVLAVAAAQGVAALSTTAWAARIGFAYTQLGLLATAQVVVQSGAIGLAAAFRVLATAMLANPALWLAGALTALVLVIKSVSDANKEAEARFQANAEAARDLGLALSEAGEAALGASKETGGVGSATAGAEPKIWSFKNATDGLTESLWEQARAARAARVEMLQQQLASAQERESAAQRMTTGGARALMDQAGQSLRQGDILGGLSQAWDAQKIRWQQVLSGGRVEREAMRDYQDAAKIAIEAQRQLKEALTTPIGASDLPARVEAVAEATANVATATANAEAASKRLAEAISDEQRAWDARNESTERYIESLREEVAQIGLSDRALRDREVSKAIAIATDQKQIDTINELAAARERALAAEANRQDDITFGASIEALQRQRGEIMLSGKALEEYRYISERLNDARRNDIALSDEQIAKIKQQAAEYAALKTSVESQAAAWERIVANAAKVTKDTADAMKAQAEAAREVVGGFFQSWFQGLREGANVFKSFARSVVDGLNNIIDRLMHRAITGFLENLIGGSGGFLGSILGSAQGNAFGPSGVQQFAKGGAFTNTIVSTPTLFRFANGAAMGEMGEAGPEAIMPLKRGPDGSLGVQVHGRAANNNNVNVNNNYNIGGVMTPEMILAAIRQGGEETMRTVQRQLPTIMQEYDRNGAVAV